MTDAEIVALIKIDLGIASTTKDALLEHLEKTAKRNIETEGITLALNDIADCDLVRMYTPIPAPLQHQRFPYPQRLKIRTLISRFPLVVRMYAMAAR